MLSIIQVTGVPIYLITGERVFNNYGSMWGGVQLKSIDRTPDDNTATFFDIAWTGTRNTGLGDPGGELGVDFPTFGFPSTTLGSDWIFANNDSASEPFRLYGISGILEVPEPVVSTPEPSSLLGYITLGGFMLGAAVRRARQ